jgi:hypothetical protein
LKGGVGTLKDQKCEKKILETILNMNLKNDQPQQNRIKHIQEVLIKTSITRYTLKA